MFISELFGIGKPKENAKAHRDGIDLEIFDGGGLERQINATSHGRDLGRVVFDVQLQGKDTILIAKDLMILPKYRGQGIAAIMYDWAKELGYHIERSPDQTVDGKYFWDKNRGNKRVWEAEQTPAQQFIEKIYGEYPDWPYGRGDKVMVWGEGEEQQFAAFALKPELGRQDTVYIDWIQAHPQRQGVGSRAIKELQTQAQQAGVKLKLMPWDKGQVSQASLTRLYKRHGFKPIGKGARSMEWEPVKEEQLDELSFLGSQCTKDCSGHRAGYEWSQRKGGRVAQSPWSPSFNKGSQLYVDGK